MAVNDLPDTPLAGRYRLVTLLGQGRTGRVWRGHDALLNRDVAVKEIVPSPAPDPTEVEHRRRIAQQVRAVARLIHPSVITVYDVIEEDERPWIVMELLEGRSLRDVLVSDGPRSPRQAAEIGLAVLAALRTAHRDGLIHGDVKPSNIMLEPDGRVVLTDFGTAPVDPTLNTTGAEPSGPLVVSPEQARGQDPGLAADLWALGVVLYTAVEGRGPFDRDTPRDALNALLEEPVEPAAHAGPLQKALDGLLRKEPGERITLTEAERLLRSVAWSPDEAADVRAPQLPEAARTLRIPTVPKLSPPHSGKKPGPKPKPTPAHKSSTAKSEADDSTRLLSTGATLTQGAAPDETSRPSSGAKAETASTHTADADATLVLPRITAPPAYPRTSRQGTSKPQESWLVRTARRVAIVVAVLVVLVVLMLFVISVIRGGEEANSTAPAPGLPAASAVSTRTTDAGDASLAVVSRDTSRLKPQAVDTTAA